MSYEDNLEITIVSVISAGEKTSQLNIAKVQNRDTELFPKNDTVTANIRSATVNITENVQNDFIKSESITCKKKKLAIRAKLKNQKLSLTQFREKTR